MPGNQKDFEKAMNDGHSAAWDQQWEQAAGYYRLALQEFPDNPNALSNLALALFELKEFEGALALYQRAANINPEDPLPLEKMARIFERLGRLKEAIRAGMQAAEMHLRGRDVEKSIENWVRVTSLQPENLPAHTRLAMIYERLGKKPEAVSEYLAAASLLQHTGDNQKATQIVMYALKLLPGSAEGSQALHLVKTGQALPKPLRPRGGTGPVRMADVRQLEAPDESAVDVQLDPISEARQRALVQLAGLLFDQADEGTVSSGQVSRRGISSVARGTGGLSLDHSTQTKFFLHLGQAIESQTHGQEAQAAEELDRAQQTGFSHPALYFDLGLLLVERDEDKALRWLLKAAKSPEFSFASHLLMGKIYYKKENYTDSAVSFLRALRLADVETVQADKRDELRQLYEPVIEALTNRKDIDAHKSLCETIMHQLIRADWLTHLINTRKQLPQQLEGTQPMPLSEMLLESRSVQVIEALANVRNLAAQGKIRTAMEEAFHALDYAPTYLPLHVQIGDLLVKENMPTAAIEKFMLISQLYNLRGEASQAISLLMRVTQIAPMDLAVRNHLIELLTEQGRVDDAIQQYMELADIYYRLAELDMTRQTYMAALRLAQQTARNRQWAYQILNSLADIDMQRLDWRQALRFFEQMRTLQPDDQVVRGHIIDLNFRLGQDKAAYTELDNYINLLENSHHREEALAFVTGVIVEQPDKSELHRRMADLYLREGKVQQAIAELDTLADAYAYSGDTDQAIVTVEEIIRLNPPDRDAYEIALVKLRNAMR
jgi:tetratricopeptide (TPR) repeat protein